MRDPVEILVDERVELVERPLVPCARRDQQARDVFCSHAGKVHPAWVVPLPQAKPIDGRLRRPWPARTRSAAVSMRHPQHSASLRISRQEPLEPLGEMLRLGTISDVTEEAHQMAHCLWVLG